MSLIVEFHVSSEDCVLWETLRTRSDLRLEAERTVGYNRETFLPFLWVTAEELADIESTLRADPTVRTVQPIDTFETAHLYEFDWNPDATSVVHAIPDAGAVMLNARGRADTWVMQVRFADEDTLSTFRTTCEEHNINLVTQWMMRPEAPKGPRQHNLTPVQRETLLVAFESGFFDIPREVSLSELAEKLGVSHQAVSERLRRSYAYLVQDTLSLGNQSPRIGPDPETGVETGSDDDSGETDAPSGPDE